MLIPCIYDVNNNINVIAITQKKGLCKYLSKIERFNYMYSKHKKRSITVVYIYLAYSITCVLIYLRSKKFIT